ncbi:MAG: hypothetical protein J1D89_03615 [Agathobacter sp.]|nr:hypothetical protein [Agathobacter sp.]
MEEMDRQNKERKFAGQWLRRRWKAVYTVEASLIVPLMIAAMALAMKLGISMYQEIAMEAEQESIADMWEVDNFYTYQALGEVFDD